MDGFWTSFSNWFNEKTSSPLYFTYTGFFIAWNWKFFQIIFLESETLFKTPRIEYIDSHLYIHVHPWLDFILNPAWHVIPPAILTYSAIVHFPHIQKWAFDVYLNNRSDRKRMFLTKKLEDDRWLLAQVLACC